MISRQSIHISFRIIGNQGAIIGIIAIRISSGPAGRKNKITAETPAKAQFYFTHNGQDYPGIQGHGRGRSSGQRVQRLQDLAIYQPFGDGVG